MRESKVIAKNDIGCDCDKSESVTSEVDITSTDTTELCHRHEFN